MPCPLFEPRTKVEPAPLTPPRLPLMHEFDGICHAGELVIHPTHRFQYCNQGNAKGKCPSFPVAFTPSSIRFAVTTLTSQILTVLMIEEDSYWPKSSTSIDFIIPDQLLQPEVTDVCRRAQLVLFCVSYLETTK